MIGFISNAPLQFRTPSTSTPTHICFKLPSRLSIYRIQNFSQSIRTTLGSEQSLSVRNGIGAIKTETSTIRGPATSVTTMEEFWHLADELKIYSQYDADKKIAFLRTASLEELRQVCIQYRYFVEHYANILPYLVHKLPNIQLRSLLASILSEELGSGKISGAHTQWYDRFLLSFGVTKDRLHSSLYKENEAILDDIAAGVQSASIAHGIGVVGMAGKFLCQIYLTVMHKNLMMNPNVQNYDGKIDWLFWNFHIGEEDIEHGRMVRACIDQLGMGAEEINELARGYEMGKQMWDMFWTNNFKNTGLFRGILNKD